MSDLGLANRYPVTMGRGVGGGASPGLDVDSIRDGLLNQPFGTNINMPPSPLQQILAGQPVGGSPGLPQMPGSTGAGILAAGPDLNTGASARPPGYVVGGANALGEAANANAQVAGYPTMPAYQPMTAAPYPAPSFAPIPDRGPDQQVPGSIGAFSALASLFSGPYAGAINAAPLEASHALADQQYKDSLTRYQMAQAQADELNRYQTAAYTNNQNVDMTNHAGLEADALNRYNAALAVNRLRGAAAGATATGGAIGTASDQAVAAQQAEAHAQWLMGAGNAGTVAQAAIQKQADWEAEQKQQMEQAQKQRDLQWKIFGGTQTGDLQRIREQLEAEGDRQTAAFGQQTTMQNALFKHEDSALNTEISGRVKVAMANHGGGDQLDYNEIMTAVSKDQTVVGEQKRYGELTAAYAKATTADGMADLGKKARDQEVRLQGAIDAATQRAMAFRVKGKTAAPGLPQLRVVPPPLGSGPSTPTTRNRPVIYEAP